MYFLYCPALRAIKYCTIQNILSQKRKITIQICLVFLDACPFEPFSQTHTFNFDFICLSLTQTRPRARILCINGYMTLN